MEERDTGENKRNAAKKKREGREEGSMGRAPLEMGALRAARQHHTESKIALPRGKPFHLFHFAQLGFSSQLVAFSFSFVLNACHH